MSLDFFDDIFIPEHALKSPQIFDEVSIAQFCKERINLMTDCVISEQAAA